MVSAADIERVKAASKGFYTALAVIDNGEAMAKVWAHTPYITIVALEPVFLANIEYTEITAETSIAASQLQGTGVNAVGG